MHRSPLFQTLTSLMFAVALCALIPSVGFANKADSISYQGEVTDASNIPVPDGVHDVTFSLWTDSVGGTMVHSEVKGVTSSRGLFTTCVGCGSNSFFDLFGEYPTLYLQIQIFGNPPISPRTLLRNVPYAFSSTSLNNQPTVGASKMSVKLTKLGFSSLGISTIEVDSDDDGIVDNSSTDSVDNTSAKHAINTKGAGAQDRSSISLSSSSSNPNTTFSSVSQSLDTDGDNDLESSIESKITPTKSSHAINTKGAGGDRMSSSSTAYPDSVENELTFDASFDPITPALMKAKEKANRTKCQNNLRCSSPTDQFDSEIDLSVEPFSAKHAINTKGAGAQDRSSISLSSSSSNPNTTFSSVSQSLDTDGDNDFESSIESKITPTVSSHAINTKGAGAERMSSSSTAYPDSVENELTFDASFDPITPALMKAKEKANRTKCQNNLRCSSPTDQFGSEIDLSVEPFSAKHAINTKGAGGSDRCAVSIESSSSNPVDAFSSVSQTLDTDGDNVFESSIESKITPTVSSHAINTKGAGAERMSSSSTAYSDSVENELSFLEDLPGSVTLMKAKEKANRTKCGSNLRCTNPNLDVDNEVDAEVTISSAKHAINTKGAGANDRIVSTATSGTVTVECVSENLLPPGSSSSVVTTCTPSSSSVALSFSGSLRSSLSSDGVGYLSSALGVDVVTPTHPIEHSSGAHLTAGGVWTNASDKNLKENHENVNGEEILEKVAELPISRWNYKNEGDEITHIGPTAQDFKAAFNVGESDKSISTIDPSGIALVAIKELKKQNQQLKEQNDRLQKQMDELSRKLDKLAARK